MPRLFFRRLVSSALLIGALVGFGGVFEVPMATAATTAKPSVRAVYSASVIALGVPQNLKPGDVDQVRVTIKNLGNTTWKRDGVNFVSLYRWDPIKKIEKASQFARPSWETPTRPARLPIASVGPSGEVSFAFPVKAPATPGVYTEQFILASENVAWIAHSTFDVKLTVSAGREVAPVVITTPALTNASTPAPAITSNSQWSAELVDKGGIEWQLEAGDHSVAEVSFRNTGSVAWSRSTGSFVSIYAVDETGKKQRVSPVVASADATKPVARLIEDRVTPGNVGHFKINLQGPTTGGLYKETFALAAENTAWLDGGSFVLPIRVPAHDEFIDTARPDIDPTAPTISNTPIATGNGLFAVLSDRSVTQLSGPGYAQRQIAVTFKNVSTVAWNNPSIRFIDLQRPAFANQSSLQDVSWNNSNEAVRLLGTTKPGDATALSFTLRLPSDQGGYTALFQLYVDGKPVQGGVVEIPLVVTSSASTRIPQAPIATPVSRPVTVTPSSPVPAGPLIEAIPLTGDVSSLPAEPVIRVGVLKTTDDQSVIQAMSVAVLVQQAGSTLCRLNPGQQTTVHYDRSSRVYILSGACTGQSSNYYIFRAEDGIAPMLVSDFASQYNVFRSELELRYTPATDSVWLINELTVEWYLKGIAETSNASPPEFQRTLLTAARTYAMYHVQRGTKHADEFYTVDSRYDQVYRGYNHELSSPTIVAAVDATRGQIVTYQGRLAITPYFSRSDGRTRGWGEVWGGGSSYPWLVSVPVPEDVGRTLWGHGVGLSASGALDMANEGKRYDYILSYFYQGTELRRAYR